MNLVVLNRRIDPSAPLSDASQLLMSVEQVITATAAPTVSKNATRRARAFRRDTNANANGATSMFRRRLTPAFANARKRTIRPSSIATLRLTAANDTGKLRNIPQVSVLTISQRRARVAAIRKRALEMRGTLRARFNANMVDWGADHRLDTPRMVQAQARFAAARGPRPRFDY